MTQENSGDTAVEEPKDRITLVEQGDPVQAEAPKAEPKTDPEPEHDEEEEDQDDSKEHNDNGKKPRRGGFQKKLERKDREIAELNDRLARLEAGRETKAETSVKSDNATGEPNPDNFQTWGEYTKALAKYEAETLYNTRETERTKKADQEKIEATQREIQTKFKGGITKAAEKYSDYDAVVGSADIALSGAVQAALQDSGDMSGEIVYYLANNPDEAQKIAKITNRSEADRALGRIEARLETKGDGEAVVRTTKAPPPITPVKSRSSGTPKSIEQLADGDDYEGYKAARQKTLQR